MLVRNKIFKLRSLKTRCQSFYDTISEKMLSYPSDRVFPSSKTLFVFPSSKTLFVKRVVNKCY